MIYLLRTTVILAAIWFSVSPLAAQPVTARIFAPAGVVPGSLIDIRILMNSPYQLGGVDFTIRYNDSLFSFVSVEQDTGLNNWEWFQTAHDALNNTVNVFSIADIANGPISPDSVDFYPKGSIATFTFFVAPNWNDSGPQVFQFHWGLCGDNGAANTRGDTLILLNTVRNYNGTVLWVEPDNLNYPENERPEHIGVPDSCEIDIEKIRFILDLQFGAARRYSLCGDPDANGTVNVSDVVYLVNFIFAGGAEPNPLESGDADCNAVVTISDAVYLITYIFAGGPAPCAACP